MKEKLLIVGMGGHGKSCLLTLSRLSSYKIQGYVDKKNKYIKNLNYLGNDKNLHVIRKKISKAIIGVGQIKTYKIRYKIYKSLKKLGYQLPTILSKSSIVSKGAIIGESSILMENTFVNAEVEIGFNCIVNTGAIIEHNVKIGNNCHISTGAIVNGDCVIGDNCFVGSRVVINNGVKIGKNNIIPSGSIVRSNIQNK